MARHLLEMIVRRPASTHRAFRIRNAWALVGEPALVVVCALGLWEVLSRTGVVFEQALPPPTRIADSLIEDVQTAYLWDSVWLTAKAWGLGMAIVVLIAIPLGIFLGLSRLAMRYTLLTLEFLRAIPSIAALPILMLLYGIGFKLTVVLVILGAIWPLLIQAAYGAQDVDPIARDTARVYGVGKFRRMRLVVLPTAAPYIGTGLRLSGVIAMILAVAATLIVGGGGLGTAIAQAEQSGQTALMFDRIFIAGVLGLIVTITLSAIERRLLRWHPGLRGDAA
jgi:ABC-type nitrate/sulfonate/bicarbonate transport system permease component